MKNEIVILDSKLKKEKRRKRKYYLLMIITLLAANNNIYKIINMNFNLYDLFVLIITVSTILSLYSYLERL